jgi:hypothetical protein
MSRIAVSEDVLSEPLLQDLTFFDPFDFIDIARRIEWALSHREELLKVQRQFYARLAERTWTDVADEHIECLERISKANALDNV